jgi:hypothetical protein
VDSLGVFHGTVERLATFLQAGVVVEILTVQLIAEWTILGRVDQVFVPNLIGAFRWYDELVTSSLLVDPAQQQMVAVFSFGLFGFFRRDFAGI